MLSEVGLREYKRLRHSGWIAIEAFGSARTLDRWEALEGQIIAKDSGGDAYDSIWTDDDGDGPLRLVILIEYSGSWVTDFTCCVDDPKPHIYGCYHRAEGGPCPYRHVSRGSWCGHKCKATARAEQEGMYIVAGEILDPLTGQWKIVDSCGGFIGEGWKDSGYDRDIMDTLCDLAERIPMAMVV